MNSTPSGSDIALVIAVAPETALHDVLRELAAIGFHAREILDAMRCVAGDAPEDRIAALRAVRGVVDVSVQQGA